MAESDNILTKLQDLLLYLIPQLNKFPRDQKFVLGDRIETKLLAVQEDCHQRKRPEMKTKTSSQKSKAEGRRAAARSVLYCGSPLPLFPGPATTATATESARGLAQSKTWRSFVALLGFCLLHSAFCLPVAAQTYSIDWSKISGGGGTSTGGVYSVSGTIGQHDAGGPMTNGQYSVTGGFWALPIAVQTADAPTLTIAPAAPGQATISWTPATPGFVLQETPSLAPSHWVNSASGAANPVTVPAVVPSKFYRLRKP